MLAKFSKYLSGIISGFALGLVAMLVMSIDTGPEVIDSTHRWIELNLGYSIWLFLLVLIVYIANLIQLGRLIATNAPFAEVVQLDQLSDVWIHLFIGIGVIWTAIGMRSALSTTLGSPAALGDGAGQILSRLVDGGILLALTTTIVGAMGGYLMQLTKTISLSSGLTTYYHQQDHEEINNALTRLARIEAHLSEMASSDHELPKVRRTRQWVIQ
jgi:hypothetical protein